MAISISKVDMGLLLQDTARKPNHKISHISVGESVVAPHVDPCDVEAFLLALFLSLSFVYGHQSDPTAWLIINEKIRASRS